jgi:hypothetical protein
MRPVRYVQPLLPVLQALRLVLADLFEHVGQAEIF